MLDVLASRHVGFNSPTKNQTHTPGTGRRSLNHWTTREVPIHVFCNDHFYLILIPYLLYPGRQRTQLGHNVISYYQLLTTPKTLTFPTVLLVLPKHTHCACSVSSVVSDSVTLWTAASLSTGFSRQEYCGGLPFPSPGDLPNPGIKLTSPALQVDSLPTELSGNSTHDTA